MDGYGLSTSAAAGDNAIKAAHTPNLDRIFAGNPTCRLSASGLDVHKVLAGGGGHVAPVHEAVHENPGAAQAVGHLPREITRTFVDPDFTGFERKKGFFHVNYVCTTSYDASMPPTNSSVTPAS